MADLERIPEPRCSRPGCSERKPNASAALKAGWVMIEGRWFCPVDFPAEADRLIADCYTTEPAITEQDGEPLGGELDYDMDDTLDIDPRDP